MNPLIYIDLFKDLIKSKISKKYYIESNFYSEIMIQLIEEINKKIKEIKLSKAIDIDDQIDRCFDCNEIIIKKASLLARFLIISSA